MRVPLELAEAQSVADGEADVLREGDSVAVPETLRLLAIVAEPVPHALDVRDTLMERELVPEPVELRDTLIERVPVTETVDVRDCLVEADTDLERPTETEDVVLAVALFVPLAVAEPDAVPVGVREILAVAVPGMDAVEVLEDEIVPVLVRVIGLLRVPTGDLEELVEPVLVLLPWDERVSLGLAVDVRLTIAVLEFVPVLVVVLEVEVEAVEVRVTVAVLVELELPVDVRVEVTERVLAGLEVVVFDKAGVLVATPLLSPVGLLRELGLGASDCAGLLVRVVLRVEVFDAVEVLVGSATVSTSRRGSIEMFSAAADHGVVAICASDSKSNKNLITLL